jgi:hypothetical protein
LSVLALQLENGCTLIEFTGAAAKEWQSRSNTLTSAIFRDENSPYLTLVVRRDSA